MRRITAPAEFNPFDSPFFIDGKYVDSNPAFRRTALTNDLIYTEAQTELNILVTALRLEGTQPAMVEKRESPDFVVRVVPNDTFYVEVTTVIEPIEAQADQKIVQYSKILQDWHLQQSGLMKAHDGLAITFFLPFPPSDRSDQELLRELERFLATEDMRSRVGRGIERISGGYPILKTLDCKTLVLAGAQFVQVSRGAMAVAPPRMGAQQVIDAIDRKIQKARNWKERPLWLVVWLTALYSWPKAILNEIEAGYHPVINIEPFEKIIIGDGTGVLVYERT